MGYLDILRRPDVVMAQAEAGVVALQARADGCWQAGDVTVMTREVDGRLLRVEVNAPHTSLQRLHLRWHGDVSSQARVLGDHWERGYGDLEWRGLVPERVLPWYFLLIDGDATHGYGVKTGPNAFCWWRVDAQGVSLWLDVRNGGAGVQLGQRTLHAADVVAQRGAPGERPFVAAQAFCKQLCDNPRLPDHPVYGSNNWYYAYGKSSHAKMLHDTEILMTYAPGGDNAPYMVMDAGWQPRATVTPACNDAAAGGPWDRGNADFPDMPGLAADIRALGARPGIWTRPLAADPTTDPARLLPVMRAVDGSAKIPVLDPSQAENLAMIEADFRRYVTWGYALIKHDWTSCDLLGRWGFDMLDGELTTPGWHFADRTRTTAEIVLDLFRAIRRGAGDALVLGCNTFSHLSAGLFELQRTGDDTSGLAWERTRKMGVNTLAFRMAQHGAFYAVDGDCVGLTTQVPWELNTQWLDLLARSGTPLFVSAAPEAVGPAQAQALRDAFAYAAQPQPLGEPLDWLHTTCPREWQFGDATATYNWIASDGILSV